MKKIYFLFHSIILLCLFINQGCYKAPEMTLEEIEAYKASFSNEIITKTVTHPWKNQEYTIGKNGGIWNATINSDPKSFNLLIAERDGETTSILNPLVDYLVDYNSVTKKWEPRLASYEVVVDSKKQTLDVIYTLRDDLYWSFYNDIKPKVKLTSDDVVFWYNEIYGDEECGSSSYNSRFMIMDDGSKKEITIEKIDELKFVFHFPKLVAEPLLSTNMSFGPRFIYKAAKDGGGVTAVKNLFSVATNPKELPSLGKFFLTEYSPSQRIVYERNPYYWEKDKENKSITYPDKMICQIVSDVNTKFLLFKQGKLEDYGPTPEQLDDIVTNANNKFDKTGIINNSIKEGYTVFNATGSLSASFWSFNQNPINKDKPYYKWFTQKKFRQAMSCLLNRDRIIKQTYRGLAEPKYTFFPSANPYYNEEIILQYRYSQQQAQKLLEECGFKKGDDGYLYDWENNKVEFDLTITSSNPIVSDISQIISDECKKQGITVNVRQTDFQKLVEQLTATYDWQSLIIGFSGGTIFPTQGSNVWVSDGNLHVWYPLQKEPATDWEARIDYLYHTAASIPDYQKAKPYWDEYQQIILEQCPVIYLVRPRSFYALSNRWNMSNVYFDNINGALTDRIYLQE